MSKTDYKNTKYSNINTRYHDQENDFYFGKHQLGFMDIDGWIAGEKRMRC